MSKSNLTNTNDGAIWEHGKSASHKGATWSSIKPTYVPRLQVKPMSTNSLTNDLAKLIRLKKNL